MSKFQFLKNLTKIFSSRKMFVIFCLGFSSGLPLALTGGTLQAWMKDAKVDLGTIGLFSMVGLPYTLKFLWAPFFDRFTLPFFGRRRGWLIIIQGILTLSVIALGVSDPSLNLKSVAIVAVLLAFFSASQDIIIDAYQREILFDNELGLGSSIYTSSYILAYRFVGGALALILADHFSWEQVYFFMAAFMGVGVLATIFAKEPTTEFKLPKTFQEAVLEPLIEYFKRKGAFEILLFIMLYKLGENFAQSMTTPFLLDLGYSKTAIGAIAKSVGLIGTLTGGMVGGLFMVRMSIQKALFTFGIFQMVMIGSFCALTFVPANTSALAVAMFLETFSAGCATSAFVAFMAVMTNKKFTATQYALLSSLMGVPRVILSSPAGFIAKSLGWTNYFLFSIAIAVPGILMLKRYHKWQSGSDQASPQSL